MTRLPVPGSDDGVWGTVLNDYLAVAHDTTGALKAGAVGTGHISGSLAHLLRVTIRRTASSNPQWLDNTGTVVDPAALHAAGFGITFECEEGYEPAVGTANGQAKSGRDIVFQIHA